MSFSQAHESWTCQSKAGLGKCTKILYKRCKILYVVVVIISGSTEKQTIEQCSTKIKSEQGYMNKKTHYDMQKIKNWFKSTIVAFKIQYPSSPLKTMLDLPLLSMFQIILSLYFKPVFFVSNEVALYICF